MFSLLSFLYVTVSVYFTADAGGNRSAGAIVPPVEHSVLWHDAIQRQRSLCQENAVLLVV